MVQRAPLWSWGHQRSFSLFPASAELCLPCLLLRAIALKMTWKQISSTTLGVGVAPGTAINVVFVCSSKYMAMQNWVFPFTYLKSKLVTIPSGFGGQSGGEENPPPGSFLGQQQTQSLKGATWRRQHCQQSLQRHQLTPNLISKT